MVKQNYQLALDKILSGLSQERRPRLLLHACCAPCSSYVLEYLSQYFSITLFYYNPNISPKEEYDKRVREVERLLREMPLDSPVQFLPGPYHPEKFFAMAKGMENLPEGGERCFSCYRLRLEQAAQAAKADGYDYFATTLSISPHKNAQKLNEIGFALAEKYGVAWLPSDFKKRGGYQRSIVLSHDYHLYRQNYCGCIYSAAEAARRREERP
ncbi:MAG: epoxyqueuosine reductase QueH [Oscillospiraceae bacterium]|jgi:predicted adenine nucleotide alpha hydrolase (AANH) superfamily ATPase|nr:epoxyqueuosine reductase QueH [Oscillospiraceae bacterium]